MADIVEKLSVPAAVRAGLRKVIDDLSVAAASRLVGLVLYGGLARGRYYPGRSDINLVVVLDDVGIDVLTAIGPVLQAAWRSWRVEPFVLARGEIEAAAAAFPIKFLDIQTHHVVLFGDDPFLRVRVARDNVRLRVEQELRNLTLRLRRRFLGITDDTSELTRALTELARPLAVVLAALLTLAGKETTEPGTSEILSAAADAFCLDGQALAQIAGLRQQTITEVDARDLYGRILTTLARAADIAACWKEAPP
jgi:hypothetical protein